MNRIAFYDFQIEIELLSYEIERSTFYARKYSDYYVVLTKRLHKVYEFMTNKTNLNSWDKWYNVLYLQACVDRLREAVMPALCNLEKYQAQNLPKTTYPNDLYMEQLSEAVLKEIKEAHINESSKVLFIGSGAFPTTAIAIARETGAEIICVDIDKEAATLGALVIEKYGLPAKICITNKDSMEFARWATHIIVASLVPEKEEILKKLWEYIDHKPIIVLRFGNGLKSILNFPFRFSCLDRWNIIQTLSDTDNMYDTLILNKN